MCPVFLVGRFLGAWRPCHRGTGTSRAINFSYNHHLLSLSPSQSSTLCRNGLLSCLSTLNDVDSTRLLQGGGYIVERCLFYAERRPFSFRRQDSTGLKGRASINYYFPRIRKVFVQHTAYFLPRVSADYRGLWFLPSILYFVQGAFILPSIRRRTRNRTGNWFWARDLST